MPQPLVLAIEPDLRQAAIVKRIVREKALADVVVVDSRDAAIEAMRTNMPDVLLLSALLSPRDEDELMAHLKTLDHAAHLQTHTIPQLASTLDPGEERSSRGLLSAFRRKKEAAPVAGCDPDMFADEIRLYLQQAADKKHHLQQTPFIAPTRRTESAAAASAETAAETDETAATESSWSSPFEWKPAGASKRSARPREDAPAHRAAPAAEPVSVIKPAVDEPSVIKPAVDEPSVITPPRPAAKEPSFVMPAVQEPVVAAPPPVVEAIPAPPIAAAAPIVEPPVPPVQPVAAKPVESPRPKPVADRPARITGRAQLRELIVKTYSAQHGNGRDRLGPLARWARSDAPRVVKNAPVASDDVRSLISSLAVPTEVASISYPHGVRIRRVRVPHSADHDGAVQASA